MCVCVCVRERERESLYNMCVKREGEGNRFDDDIDERVWEK